MSPRIFLCVLFAAWPCFAKLRVAASTTFVGEVVAAIGGDAIDVDVIYPRDADPHAFEPTPRDIAKLGGETIIFENGLGLETALQGPLKALQTGGIEIIEVSRGISARTAGGSEDPHVWSDPIALMTWTTNIETTLVRLDPADAAGFHECAAACRKMLVETDSWIRKQVEKIPAARRVLVTDHDALEYFAHRYGFKIVGTVLPGFSTLAEPSPRELAALEETIRREKVPAVFVDGPATPVLARRVAEDTGAKLITLPGCSLGAAGSETGTLPGYLRTLATRIAEGLK